MSGISRDDWLKALGDADVVTDDSALTVADICQQFNLCEDAVRERLRKLVASGSARRVVKIVPNSLGHKKRVTAFVLLPPNQSKRKKQ
jgi:DNA-binding Lrp family transcriptional regulator